MLALKERAAILPMPEQAPICATVKCRRPLTKLGEPWNCWICLRCNSHPSTVNKKQKMLIDQSTRGKALDVRLTEGQINKLVDKRVEEALARMQGGIPAPRSEPEVPAQVPVEQSEKESDFLNGMNKEDMMNPELAEKSE
ncbi:MAG: hypothetical protein FVQ84_09140 [Planctomycetes bacterium]|nr:hypothetical protein [Planctomycetota bacterium]